MIEAWAEPVAVWYAVAVLITVYLMFVRKISNLHDRIRQRTPARPEEKPPAQPRLIFTLVHGTWARNAPWTKEGSRLRAALAEAFPPCGFLRFEWSGRNSEKARRAAADDLERFLEEAVEAHPNATHIIVAHSHGGNVALMALSRKIARSMAGLVCLATPVIVHRERKLSWLASTMFDWFALPSAFIFGGFAGELIGGEGSDAIAVFALGATVIAWLLTILWRRFARADHVPLAQVHVLGNRAVFVRFPGDEATLAIGASSLISLVLERIVTLPLEYIGDAIDSFSSNDSGMRKERYIGLAILITIFAVIQVSGFEMQWPDRDRIESLSDVITPSLVIAGFICFVSLLFRTKWLLLFVAFAVSGLIIPFVLVPIIAIGWLFLGRGMGLAVATSHVTVEVTPPGLWQTAHIEDERGERDLQRSDRRMQHSRVYESDSCLVFIREWIATVIDGAEQDPARKS